MQINLINGFYIETDNRNYTLKQKYIGTRKDGTKKESVKIISHCGSLEQALETFLRINQVPKEAIIAVDLMSYADFIEQSNKEAVRALKSVLEGNHDDVCEWEKGSSGYVGYPAYYSKCCATNSKGLEMQTHIISDWKYCPYCGKKIKMVE